MPTRKLESTRYGLWDIRFKFADRLDVPLPMKVGFCMRKAIDTEQSHLIYEVVVLGSPYFQERHGAMPYHFQGECVGQEIFNYKKEGVEERWPPRSTLDEHLDQVR